MIYEMDAKRFDDDKIHVVCCSCALARNGLVYDNPEFLVVFTTYKELDNFNAGIAAFVYNSVIDCEHYVKPVVNNPKLLIPTKERAIVESIIFFDSCDEGLLIEALKNYLYSNPDLTELYTVADFFKLERSKLDYWIKEAIEDEDE